MKKKDKERRKDRKREKPPLLEIEQILGFQGELWLPSEERFCDQGCIFCTLSSWKSYVEEISVTVGCYTK